VPLPPEPASALRRVSAERMATPARRIALDILTQVEAGGVSLSDLLAAQAPSGLDARERAFLHELVLGTLRHRGAIDHGLAAVLDRPITKVEPRALAILRLGAGQLLRLRVPPRAVVNESVELARRTIPRAAPFVNAVLRRLSREGPASFPDPVADPRGWLTTEGSLPAWLAERWMARLGAEVAVARARALLKAPGVVFRLNPRRPEAAARAAELEPKALLVPGAFEAAAGRITEITNEGLVYPQEQGSQLVAHLAAAEGIVLDACAAPGGKATLMADLRPRAVVVAAEGSRRRLSTLGALVRRWGAANVACVGADILRPPFHAAFSAVLLDAPCTGLGTLARHPDIRWRSSEADIPRQAERQSAMIQSAASLVRPGGRLVYATCSSEPEENENVVAAFLERHLEFSLSPLPAWASGFAPTGFARTRPEAGEGEAYFAAVLARAA
jgi:16S rRNA (cytosine967-C5)-methyltransferase